MALPSLDKTYGAGQIDPSNLFGGVSALDDHRSTLRGLKDILIGFTGAAWTVEGSSDGSTAAMDASDRWLANSNLVWAAAGVAHSWMVLEQDGINALNQLCLDLTPLDAGVQGPLLTIVWSPAVGFSGGSTTARPTASDEIVLLDGAQWLGTSASSPSFSARVHGWCSTDGQANKALIHINNVPVFLFVNEDPQNPRAGWTNPAVAGVVAATSASDSVLTYAKLWSVPWLKALIGGTECDLYASCEGYAGQAAGDRMTWADDQTGDWHLFPIACITETSGQRGRVTGLTADQRGFFDLWFGSSARGKPNDEFPSGGTKTFVQFGVLVFPWDGTTPSTA